MRNRVVILTLLLCMIGGMTAFSQESRNTNFSVNGVPQALSAAPQVLNNSLMVPIADFVKTISCGDTVVYGWDDKTKTALIKMSFDVLLEVSAGENQISLYGRYREKDMEDMEEFHFGNDGGYILLEKITLEQAPVIYQGKMLVPLSFLAWCYQDSADVCWEKESNRLNLHVTYYRGYTIPLIRAYPEENRIATVGLSENFPMRHSGHWVNSIEDFNPDYFTADFSGVREGSGTIVVTGKEYPERMLHMTVDDEFVTNVEDNVQTLTKKFYEESGVVTENDAYTEFLSDRFRIRLYCEKVFSSESAVVARGEVTYIGPEEEFYFFHGAPYFTLSLSGGKYHLGSFVDDVGISSALKKGVSYEFKLRNGGGYDGDAPDAAYWRAFYSKPEIMLPQGEYTISGRFEGKNLADGKRFTARVEREITVK